MFGFCGIIEQTFLFKECDKMKLLNHAVHEKIKLEMIYMARNGKVSQRFVRVLEIREDHILAYCFYRKRVRTFKIENILSVQKANRKAASA